MDQSQQSASVSPPPPPPPPPLQQAGPKLMQLDFRAKETMKWSALWNAVSVFIEQIFSYISLFFVGGFLGGFMELGRAFNIRPEFSVGNLITELFWGAVWGALGGFILSKFYSVFQEWNRKYLGGRLNTFFKLLFYPTAFGGLIALILSGALAFVIGILPLVITIAGVVFGRFIYAKMMTKIIGKLYI